MRKESSGKRELIWLKDKSMSIIISMMQVLVAVMSCNFLIPLCDMLRVVMWGMNWPGAGICCTGQEDTDKECKEEKEVVEPSWEIRRFSSRSKQ